MSYDDDYDNINVTSNTTTVTKDPLEKAKQKLRDKQEDEHENLDKPYAVIKIPTKNKVGEKCVIKINQKVPHVQIAVSQDISWKRRDKFAYGSKPELICKAFKIDEFKDTNKVEFIWDDIGLVRGKETNLLLAGEYMIECRVWSTVAGEETTSRRLVEVVN